MKNVAKLHSRANGQYYTYVGDGDYMWLPVTGKVVKASRKVFAGSSGVAHIRSKVILKTRNGPKKAFISQASKKSFCEKGGLGFIHSRVVGKRVRRCKITGNCSNEVSTN